MRKTATNSMLIDNYYMSMVLPNMIIPIGPSLEQFKKYKKTTKDVKWIYNLAKKFNYQIPVRNDQENRKHNKLSLKNHL